MWKTLREECVVLKYMYCTNVTYRECQYSCSQKVTGCEDSCKEVDKARRIASFHAANGWGKCLSHMLSMYD